MFPGKSVILHPSAHIGHGAVIHGAIIGKNSLIGMNAVIMDDVVIEEECIIGALSFLKAGTHVTRRSLFAGNPAKFIKSISDDMLDWKTEGTALYQSLPKQCYDTLKPCEPLRELPKDRPKMEEIFKPFKR